MRKRYPFTVGLTERVFQSSHGEAVSNSRHYGGSIVHRSTSTITLYDTLSRLTMMYRLTKEIEDIYFFEVNTEYTSSNVLKIVISRVRSTSEITDIFNT